MKLPAVARRIGVLGVALATLLVGAGCDLEDVFGARITATRTESASFAVVGRPVVDIQSSNGTVDVRGVPGQTDVQAIATLTSRGDSQTEADGRLARIVVRMVQEGDRVTLAYRSADQAEDVRRYSGVAFSVTVPPSADVQANTSNGAVAIAEIHGAVTIATSNGEVVIHDAVGDVCATTSNGRIAVERSFGVLTLTTSNGEIRVLDATAALDATTSNGPIVFRGTPVGMDNSLHTSNGSIDVSIPVAASVQFIARTSVGSIRTSMPLVGDTDGREWNATFNPPASSAVTIRTSNGSVRLGTSP